MKYISILILLFSFSIVASDMSQTLLPRQAELKQKSQSERDVLRAERIVALHETTHKSKSSWLGKITGDSFVWSEGTWLRVYLDQLARFPKDAIGNVYAEVRSVTDQYAGILMTFADQGKEYYIKVPIGAKKVKNALVTINEHGTKKYTMINVRRPKGAKNLDVYVFGDQIGEQIRLYESPYKSKDEKLKAKSSSAEKKSDKA